MATKFNVIYGRFLSAIVTCNVKTELSVADFAPHLWLLCQSSTVIELACDLNSLFRFSEFTWKLKLPLLSCGNP